MTSAATRSQQEGTETVMGPHGETVKPSAAYTDRREGVLRSDFGHIKIEYVGGHRPYLWIADSEGKFIDTIDVKAIREFLKGQRRW